MGQRKDIDGSASVPTFYGKELRWKREEAGLTLQQLVEGSFYGPSHLSEIERGQRRMPAELAEHVDRTLGTDGFFRRRCEDVRKAKRRGHASYFERVLEAEKHAETIEEWCPTLIPGLLQTDAYARAVVRAAHPLAPDDEVEEKVTARMARASLFEDNHKTPEYWAILPESLLRQPMLPPARAAEQLERIVALATRRRIVPQILPWNCGPHPLMLGTAKIMTFPDAPPLVYTEAQYSGDTIDDPALVKQYRKAYDRLRAAALPPEASLALIEQTAEDDRNGKQRD
ncbi:helix-turn-helix transcriptional regulator [Streptomyces sp. NBC_01221]|uniref:helix-turn-helix domain-containing protein n=1 Tax=unclassified Streptomyces TaxID=2593676 RepID=UPI002256E44A|nr:MULTISPECIES: helix-turn-helix transcriptional regulator [unclassified Streptomyces]MCX4788847.1 helix-turn-helix transcriptional regulator [Streptomyces sp. NBC_01221]MCX4795405.1 helix-turn-helix transcriptional regulator [Streptomyces sp. NBC_01242]WSJ36703.1 helix-turn-helix transcriptional regulator [Streptomyces sp. NBC_01321]WSU22230.1 helix-turn-helix transcriptional regulator [Streptomyces sp. NBC_01108]